jgi:hypothetical protein
MPLARQPPEDRVYRLAAAVARGASVRAAARAIGLPERTARRWAQLPQYRYHVAEIRRQVNLQTVGKLSRVALKAAGKLEELLDEPGLDHETHLKAIRAAFADLVAMTSAFAPEGGQAGPDPRGGLTIPGLDERWQGGPEPQGEGEGGGDPCATPGG